MSAEIELLAQTGAGPDGVSYRARLNGTEVEYRVLNAQSDPQRRDALSKRLQRARLLEHPGTRRIRRLDLARASPTVVLDLPAGTVLAQHLAGRLPLVPIEAVALVLDLAAALHAAHRLGLGHGRISPDTVSTGTTCLVQMDFTGLAVLPNDIQMSLSEADACSADVVAVAAMLAWLATSDPFDPYLRHAPVGCPEAIRAVIAEILTIDPLDRPSIGEVETKLRQLLRTLQQQASMDLTNVVDAVASPTGILQSPQRERLGRFRLVEKLGQGGMGEVWRAIDTSDDSVVAIKTLLPEYAQRPDAVSRFRKEARMLKKVNNPYVANLLEVNDDDDIHYIVVEFVPGRSLARQLDAGEPLEESFSLGVIADVCRALVDAHKSGIIHRDLKPDNILLLTDPSAADVGKTIVSTPDQPLAELSDFGLARHVDQSESMHMTRTGSVVGTPLYLAPEQCRGEHLDPRADIYSLGATLFHLLAGRPPYAGDSPLALIHHHCNSPIPDLRAINSAVSEGAAQVVTKALAKSPAHRHADADELLRDILRVLRGEPSSLVAHPLLPRCDAKKIFSYDFRWELESSPLELWPHVSNTERLNRAINLPAVEWITKPDETGRVRRTGKLRKLGLEVAWEEHPFEWIEGRRFGVLRECKSGPLKWLLSMVDLEPRPGGGTILTHRFRIEPNGILGRTFVAVEIGMKTRRALERVYKRIDSTMRSKGAMLDPFEDGPRLSQGAMKRIDEVMDRLAARGVDLNVLERLGEYIATAPPQEAARIRPIALARRLNLSPEAFVAACLHGAREGLLATFWDLICPLCRIPSEMTATLKAMREHGRCEACNADYDLDFGRSVELVFRPHPTIREVELGVFCIGGPAHSPHVVAQVRVAAGERIEVELALTEGAYRLRGPQLPTAIELRVQAGAMMARAEVELGNLPKSAPSLRPGGQVLALKNPHTHELVVRLERMAERDDALTAARAASLSLFRELFPGEVLSAGRLVSVANVSLLATEVPGLSELNEAAGFAKLHEHLQQVEGLARQYGGTLVKAVGDGALAAFHEPGGAARVLLALPADLRLALHRGPAMAATINDSLDYFGLTVRVVAALLRAARPGERLVTQSVTDDPAVMAIFQQAGLQLEVISTGADGMIHRVKGNSR